MGTKSVSQRDEVGEGMGLGVAVGVCVGVGVFIAVAVLVGVAASVGRGLSVAVTLVASTLRISLLFSSLADCPGSSSAKDMAQAPRRTAPRSRNIPKSSFVILLCS